jgi:hypothetical protein
LKYFSSYKSISFKVDAWRAVAGGKRRHIDP